MTVAAIFPNDVRPSIDNNSWAGSVVSDWISGNGVGDGRWWVTEHLFNDVLWCHIQCDFIGCKIDQGVTGSELPRCCQICVWNVGERQTLRARWSVSLGEHRYPRNSASEGLYMWSTPDSMPCGSSGLKLICPVYI